ncbi:MAG: exodeoxyribonuclease large subunit [Bacteroidota bacterium]
MITNELTVTLLTRLLQEVIEEPFRHVRVVGEITNYKRAASGHHYFTLKDELAQIQCVMWNSRPVQSPLSDGMRVIVTGRITVYAQRGNYQIDCSSVAPAGIGELYIAFEKLKQELLTLGYFERERKKSIPGFPQNIGIATSASGAVLHDILTTLNDRMPSAHVFFRPTLVQGQGSVEDIVRAIKDLHEYPCDVIIVGRGGGSLEDLWSFNTRPVADAIYNARIPIISAVGHETDTSIADMVADLRAPTPSLAAVACTPVTYGDYLMHIDQIAVDLGDMVRGTIATIAQQAEEWYDGTIETLVRTTMRSHSATLDTYVRSSGRALNYAMQSMRQRTLHAGQLLQSLRPLAPLDRGFALVYSDNKVVRSVDSLEPGQVVQIRRAESTSTAIVQSSESNTDKNTDKNSDKNAKA